MGRDSNAMEDVRNEKENFSGPYFRLLLNIRLTLIALVGQQEQYICKYLVLKSD